MWHVEFSKQAVKDAKRLKAAGLDRKAKSLIEVVRPDSFANPPAYESLVGNLSCHYSSRSSIQHRFVYRVVQGAVVVDGEASIWAGARASVHGTECR